MTDTAELPARRMSLLDMLTTFEELFDMVDATDDEEEQRVIRLELDRMFLVDLPRKVDGIAMYDRHCKAKIGERKTEKQEIEASRKQEQRKHELFRAWITLAVEKAPDKKVRGGSWNLSVQPGEKHVNVWNVDALPDEYVIRKPDGKAIYDALKAGKTVPGAELVDGEPVLYIKANARVTTKGYIDSEESCDDDD